MMEKFSQRFSQKMQKIEKVLIEISAKVIHFWTIFFVNDIFCAKFDPVW